MDIYTQYYTHLECETTTKREFLLPCYKICNLIYECSRSTPPYLTLQQKLFQMSQTLHKNLIRNLLEYHPQQQMRLEETKKTSYCLVRSTIISEDLHFIDTFLPHIKKEKLVPSLITWIWFLVSKIFKVFPSNF